MKALAEKIATIISDYRSENGIRIDSLHVLKWVHQFNVGDQEFLLEELLHVLPQSYISRKEALKTVSESFEYLAKKYEHADIKEFLSHAKFLDCQAKEKSQSELLSFMNFVSEDKYGLPLEKCGQAGIKYWIYFDDVLASGGTFKREIKEEIDSYGKGEFAKDKIKIIGIFFFLHTWGSDNAKYVIEQEYGKEIARSIELHRVTQIDNNPNINYYNSNPAFNMVYPLKNEQFSHWDEYLGSLAATRNDKFSYRNGSYPVEEKFYRSKDSRIRYENILLNKGLDILKKVDHLSPPIRPLGLTNPSYKTFGTGSHAFTWRNISNTCPIVFWWENHGWHPLFSVHNRGKN